MEWNSSFLSSSAQSGLCFLPCRHLLPHPPLMEATAAAPVFLSLDQAKFTSVSGLSTTAAATLIPTLQFLFVFFMSTYNHLKLAIYLILVKIPHTNTRKKAPEMEDVQVAVSFPALPWCLDALWHAVGFQCIPAVWLKERIRENWKCSRFTDWKLGTWQDMSIAHDSVAKIWPSSDSRSVLSNSNYCAVSPMPATSPLYHTAISILIFQIQPL